MGGERPLQSVPTSEAARTATTSRVLSLLKVMRYTRILDGSKLAALVYSGLNHVSTH
jgi:hypothetical protein